MEVDACEEVLLCFYQQLVKMKVVESHKVEDKQIDIAQEKFDQDWKQIFSLEVETSLKIGRRMSSIDATSLRMKYFRDNLEQDLALIYDKKLEGLGVHKAALQREVDSISPQVISWRSFDKDDTTIQELFDRLNECNSVIGQNKPKIIITGETSSGKSTFLNCILGCDVLPHGARTTTLLPWIIVYGEDPRLEFVTSEDNREKCKDIHIQEWNSTHLEEAIEAEIQGEPKSEDYFRLSWPLSFLKVFHLVDSPGLNSFQRLDNITLSAAPKALGVITLCKEGLLSEAMKNLLAGILDAKNGFCSVVFIQTKVDQMMKEDLESLKKEIVASTADLPRINNSSIIQFDGALASRCLFAYKRISPQHKQILELLPQFAEDSFLEARKYAFSAAYSLSSSLCFSWGSLVGKRSKTLSELKKEKEHLEEMKEKFYEQRTKLGHLFDIHFAEFIEKLRGSLTAFQNSPENLKDFELWIEQCGPRLHDLIPHDSDEVEAIQEFVSQKLKDLLSNFMQEQSLKLFDALMSDILVEVQKLANLVVEANNLVFLQPDPLLPVERSRTLSYDIIAETAAAIAELDFYSIFSCAILLAFSLIPIVGAVIGYHAGRAFAQRLEPEERPQVWKSIGKECWTKCNFSSFADNYLSEMDKYFSVIEGNLVQCFDRTQRVGELIRYIDELEIDNAQRYLLDAYQYNLKHMRNRQIYGGNGLTVEKSERGKFYLPYNEDYIPKDISEALVYCKVSNLHPTVEGQIDQICERCKDSHPQLSNDQRTLISYYTSDVYYKQVNCELHHREMDEPDRLSLVYHLLQAACLCPFRPGVVFRGIPGKVSKLPQCQYKIENFVIWVSCTSTTRLRKKAENFGQGKEYTIFEINQTSGRDISPFSIYSQEEETFLFPNTVFEVMEIDFNDQYVDVVKLREIPDSELAKIIKFL